MRTSGLESAWPHSRAGRERLQAGAFSAGVQVCEAEGETGGWTRLTLRSGTVTVRARGDTAKVTEGSRSISFGGYSYELKTTLV